MSDFSIKRGDLRPAIGVTLKLSDGTIVDLTGKVIEFRMRLKGTTGPPKVQANADIIDALKGTVEYRWAGSDTDAVGSYRGEFEIDKGTPTAQTHPNDRDLRIEVFEDVAE